MPAATFLGPATNTTRKRGGVSFSGAAAFGTCSQNAPLHRPQTFPDAATCWQSTSKILAGFSDERSLVILYACKTISGRGCRRSNLDYIARYCNAPQRARLRRQALERMVEFGANHVSDGQASVRHRDPRHGHQLAAFSPKNAAG